MCRGELVLPGSNVTEAMLEACATALDSRCWKEFAVPAECVFRGTLDVGESCYGGHQCASGGCADGACAVPVAANEPCIANVPCADGTTCTEDDSGAKATCVPTTYGAAGDACNGFDKDCDGTHVCKLPANCTTDMCGQCADADPPGSAGAACTNDDWTQCAPGLGCVNWKCTPITWVSPGGPCGPANAICLVGFCDKETTGSFCPQVLADGAPCAARDNLHSCDTFAECIDGVCTRNHTLGWPKTTLW